ncbi:MAG: GNAT family N-acetyltransferase [Phycisphaeraceae bacterium]
MALLDSMNSGPGGEFGYRFEKAPPDRRREAIGVLLTGRPSATDPAVGAFLRYCEQQDLGTDELWLAWRDERPRAAVMLVRCPGRSGMLFLSPASSWPDGEVVASLVRTACMAQSPSAVRLIQSLLDPHQARTRRALKQAGFSELATLVYMQRPAEPRDASLRFSDPAVRVHHYSEETRELFEQAILASYEQTRDCPGLLGLRTIEDIVAGHQASGEFHPELWHGLTCEGEPVGVMLLSDVPHCDALELVYLGLAVRYRGQGIAKRLLEHAISTAAAWGRSSLMLAVDRANEPARRLYEELGFEATGRKEALIYVPPETE